MRNSLNIRNLLIILLSLALFTSCSDLKNNPQKDVADSFVGYYTYRESYFMTWGSASDSFNGDGAFKLTKLSSNKVKMTGAWTSIGEIEGDTVSFSDDIQSGAEGYIVIKFGVGSLYGNTLTFSYNGSGSLQNSSGVAYPFSCTGKVVATKQ